MMSITLNPVNPKIPQFIKDHPGDFAISLFPVFGMFHAINKMNQEPIVHPNQLVKYKEEEFRKKFSQNKAILSGLLIQAVAMFILGFRLHPRKKLADSLFIKNLFVCLASSFPLFFVTWWEMRTYEKFKRDPQSAIEKDYFLSEKQKHNIIAILKSNQQTLFITLPAP